MEYRCKTGQTETTLTCTTHKDGFSTEIDGIPYEVSVSPVDENRIHLLVNGQGVLAHVEEIEGGKRITIDGVPVEILDADSLPESISMPNDIPGDVTPPMPSMVVSLHVSEGDVVEKSAPLITLSAMKMETTLTAPFDGRVTSINTSPGAQVMPGEILVALEPIAPDEEKTGTGG